jgi:hypothetical protein
LTKDEALKLAKSWFEANTYGDEAVEVYEAIEQVLADSALDRMAENARELGLDYEPAPVQGPCGWQFYQDGKWHNGMETHNHRANTEAAGVPLVTFPKPVHPLVEAYPPKEFSL